MARNASGNVLPAVQSPRDIATVISAVWSNTVVTLTTDQPHGLLPGDAVCVAGITPQIYNGTYVALHGTSHKTIRYTKNKDPGRATVLGGIRPPKRRRRSTQLLPRDSSLECRLRLQDVLAIVGCSKSHWYDLISNQLAPSPQRSPSSRISTWPSTDIAAFLDGQYDNTMITADQEVSPC